jgi:CDP-diacylglycerol--glycerol-3-phosphate 3-phosphatidyltransferase
MYAQVPNQLTLLRLILAAVFFVVLNQYRYAAAGDPFVLPVAIAIFILAAITDSLDGYLARRWNVESTFGRIMDPLCDKVLVIGAFVYLAGPRFVDPQAVEAGSFFTMITGVYPWMVVLILTRELLVTSVRGELENSGVQFGANVFGKLKMILQSFSIPILLAIVWLNPVADRQWLAWVRDILVYLTIIVTVLSGVPYVVRAAHVLRKKNGH